MEKRSYKRRQYFIKPALQLRYMTVIILWMLTTAFIAGYLFYFSIWGAIIPEFSEEKLIERLEASARSKGIEQLQRAAPEDRMLSIFKEAEFLSAHEQEAVANILKEANLKLIPKLIVLILAMAIVSIFVSHKIAGPIYRFEKSAKAIEGGDLTPKFKLRKGDELKELADALDKMTASIRSRIKGVLESVRGLSSGLDKLARISQGSEEKRIISELKTDLRGLEKNFSSFKIES